MKGNDRLILRSRDQNNLLHQFTDTHLKSFCQTNNEF